ncbi:acyl carrier protein [bacterium]|nr:acyl carrier protein [bacterium]
MNMKTENLEMEIRSMIAEIAEMDEKEIEGNISFQDELGFDSMTALEIIAKLEKKYKIKISEGDLPNMIDLNSTISIVQKYLR